MTWCLIKQGICLDGVVLSQARVKQQRTGFIWLWIGSSGALLWTRRWTFGFHKRWMNFWLAERLSASQEGLYSINIVNLILLDYIFKRIQTVIYRVPMDHTVLFRNCNESFVLLVSFLSRLDSPGRVSVYLFHLCFILPNLGFTKTWVSN
jgi:hypothetical protein